MAKANGKQPSKNIQNKHILSRVSYLQKAATYLSQNIIFSATEREEDTVLDRSQRTGCLQTGQCLEADDAPKQPNPAITSSTVSSVPACGTQCYLLSHLRQTARKAQVRVAPEIKRSVCKRCDALLLAGSTCTVKLENQSKHGKKPWSDVRVVECSNCGAKKRFPIGAKRQGRKGTRKCEDEKGLIPEPVSGDVSIK